MHGAADIMCGAAKMMDGVADMMHTVANTMHDAADMMAQWVRPPYMEKNNLILNEYLGIFMHFESIFSFFKSGKWTFSDPPNH